MYRVSQKLRVSKYLIENNVRILNTLYKEEIKIVTKFKSEVYFKNSIKLRILFMFYMPISS